MITFFLVFAIFVLGSAWFTLKNFKRGSSIFVVVFFGLMFLGVPFATLVEGLVGEALPSATTTETHQLEVVLSYPDRDIYLDRLEGFGNEMYIYIVTENGLPDLRWVNADIDKVRIVYDGTGGAWYEITSTRYKERWYDLISSLVRKENSLIFHLPPGGADIGV